MRKVLPLQFLVATMLLLLAGCGPETGGRMAVSGKVTLDGQSLDHGTISFSDATGGPVTGGALITAGSYELTGAQGLLPGNYRVTISSPQEATTTEADYAAGRVSLVSTERVPDQYNTASTLEVTVSADGKNQFDFDL